MQRMVEYKPGGLEDVFLAIEKLSTDITDPRVIIDEQKVIVVPGDDDEGWYAYRGSLEEGTWKNWTVRPREWVEKALWNIGVIRKVAWQSDVCLTACDWRRSKWLKEHDRDELSIHECPFEIRRQFAIDWFS